MSELVESNLATLLRMYYGFGKSQILSSRKVKESKVNLL